MKKFLILLISLFCLNIGILNAKEAKWQDENEDFSKWTKVIVLEIQESKNSEKIQEKSMLLPTNDKNVLGTYQSEISGMDGFDLSGPNTNKVTKAKDVKKENEITFDQVDATANEQWKIQVGKLKKKKVEIVFMPEVLLYLLEKAPSEDWQELWKVSSVDFFQKAAPYLEGYADGILWVENLSFRAGEIYVPPSTRTETYNQGGSWNGRSYTPRMVTRTVTTPGYYTPSWQGSAGFVLAKLDGTKVWTYQKYANKTQKSLFKTKKPDKFFEDFFTRALWETPLFKR